MSRGSFFRTLPGRARCGRMEVGVRKISFGDFLLTGEIIIIGMAEAVHLAALFLGLSFARCSKILGGLTGAAFVFGAGFLLVRRRAAAKSGTARRGGSPAAGQRDRAVTLLRGMFLAVAASQLIFICGGDTMYRQGDMTVETVGSFLAADAVWQVNPMTGMPYLEGMPLRRKILCLPTLYGSLCRLTGLRPETVVWTIVPAAVLLSCYVAYGALGKALFPEDPGKRACFLLAVAVLLWTGAYGYGMDGFGALCSWWQGAVIRNVVLLPWLLSLCLRKKWPGIVLCVLAEACMAWTLYGLGACAALGAGMGLAQLCCGKRAAASRGKGGAG